MADPKMSILISNEGPAEGWYFEFRLPGQTRSGWAEKLDGVIDFLEKREYEQWLTPEWMASESFHA